jgi:hypothetical protein
MDSNSFKATEHFEFGSSAELTNSGRKRDIRAEVTNKNILDQSATLEAFEKSKGIIRAKPNDLSEYTFSNVILDPERQEDQDRLNKLLNDKDFVITLWKDTWTQLGSFRIFIVYGSKKPKEPTSN